MTLKNKLLKYLGVISIGLSFMPVQTALGQANDVSDYEALNEFLYINPASLESEVDMTTLPYYDYGELHFDEVLAQTETYFDATAEPLDMEVSSNEMVAPFYGLGDTGYKMSLVTGSNPTTQADTIHFDMYKSLQSPYTPGLPNNLIDAYYMIEDGAIPISDQELQFMSSDEAKNKVSDLVNTLFEVDAMDIQLRSMTQDEMQVYIDYQNIHRLKPETTEPYTDEVNAVYFGKIVPQIEGYPIHVADHTGMNEYTIALQGTFAITEDGFEFFQFAPFTPIGEEAGNYEEVISYDVVLDAVNQQFTFDPEDNQFQVKPPSKHYIRSISVVYMPVNQTDLGTAGYFPMWQVDYSLEEDLETEFHMFVNPVNGEIF